MKSSTSTLPNRRARVSLRNLASALDRDSPNRLFVALCAAVAVAVLIYLIFGHIVVQLVYDARLPLIRSLIRNQHLSLPEHYFAMADAAVWRLAILVLGSCLGYVVVVQRVPRYFRPHLLLACFVALSLLIMKPAGHDWEFHVFKLKEAALQFSSGQFPIYFSPNIANGKTLPVFVFYSWVLCVPSFLLVKAGLSEFAALKLILLMLAAVAATGMYICLRRWSKPFVAAFGTLLFVTSTYFMGDIFTRFAFAEFHAYALLPWACWLLMRAIEVGAPRTYLALAVVLSLMVITHPFTALNSSVGLACFGVVIAATRHGRDARQWLSLGMKAAATGALVIVLTAFYCIPLAVEAKYALQERALPVDYRSTFLSARDYLAFFTFTNIGLPLLVASAATCSLLWAHKEKRSKRTPFVLVTGVVFVVYLFLTTRASAHIWDSVSWLQKQQFAWRMLLPMTCFATLFVTWRFQESERGFQERVIRWASPLSVASAVLSVVLSVDAGILVPPNAEERVPVLKAYTMENGWGVGEFLPNPASIPIVAAGEMLGTATVTADAVTTNTVQYRIEPVERAGYYEFDRFWHVRYRALAQRTETPVLASASGKVAIRLEGHETTVTLSQVRPGYVVYSELVSAIGWMFVVSGTIMCRSKWRQRILSFMRKGRPK